MKRFKLLLFLGLLFITAANASTTTTNDSFSTNYLWVGVIKRNTSGDRERHSNCENFGLISLKQGDKVIISGASYCRNGSSEFNLRRIYQVCTDDGLVWINGDDLATHDSIFYKVYRLSESDQDIFRTNALRYFKSVGLYKLQEKANTLKRIISSGVRVSEFTVYDESEYTEGTSFRVSIYNGTKKTIKYVTINFSGYNAVDDIVKARGGLSVVPLKGIGPVAPDQSASYTFEYAWLTDIVEYAKIKSIKVQYMDNSIITIPNNGKLVFNEKEKEAFED